MESLDDAADEIQKWSCL